MNQKEQKFVDSVWSFYKQSGRHDLPWRKHIDPYRILVSELMLQQTQVARVIPKFETFIERWPTVADLAGSKLGDVLRAWQGLGYNRRAKYLHETARIVHKDMADMFPTSEDSLRRLPGIGPYTAAAVVAFAYNKPITLIETNVRQVFLHHFFERQTVVSDNEILQVVARTVPQSNARVWYWALMDYGSYLKQQHGNLGSKSKHYKKQSKFKGSDREVRGAILRSLSALSLTEPQLYKELTFPKGKIDQQLKKLCAEGLVAKQKNRLQLP